MNRVEQEAIKALRDLIRANSVQSNGFEPFSAGWKIPPPQWYHLTNGVRGRERLPNGANLFRQPVKGCGWQWIYRERFGPSGWGSTPAAAYADSQSKLKRHDEKDVEELKNERMARGMQNSQAYDSKLAAQAYCGDSEPETLWQRVMRAWGR